MDELTIEWRHYVKEGGTCLRCSATGKTLEKVIADLRKELAPLEIRIAFTETQLLEEAQIPESNMILFNGIPLEDLLAAEVSENTCPSCACLTGRETSCRTVEYEGKRYEEVPEELIRIAAEKALRIRR